jgi:hypothetical protein
MKDALFISWVGMGLVFVGLIALWVMMAIVVNLTNVKKSLPEASDSLLSLTDKDLDLDCKRKAAAAAVTTAMALMNTSFTSSPHRENESLSPWQAAHRNRQQLPIQIFPRRKD